MHDQPLSTYRDLLVWQKAMDLVTEVYQCTKSFPRDEMFGLVAQMRRSSVSVPSNIAEGKGRRTSKELVQFLFNARGSLLELQTQISISERLSYLNESEATKLEQNSAKVAQLLNGMIRHFRQAGQSVSEAGEI
jgi:four helix bundle protein